MKIIAINGSPRKNNNTATLCKEFLKGAESVSNDIETEIINIYDLNFTGCKSCFGCKTLKGDTYGKCIIKDDLQNVLDRVANADGIVFGSPIGGTPRYVQNRPLKFEDIGITNLYGILYKKLALNVSIKIDSFFVFKFKV